MYKNLVGMLLETGHLQHRKVETRKKTKTLNWISWEQDMRDDWGG
jgi:hypothetical protein